MKFAYLIEPPFNYLDKTGRVTGSDVELARHVFCQLGIKSVEFVEAEFADLLPGLNRRDWHMTTGLAYSESTLHDVHFCSSMESNLKQQPQR
ncbi:MULTISPECIES: transporter substrate-binding domain-containing protein [Hyphomicrobiales]|uniref:transporter substrate-binding domain-containing protein n=1 Tax=Hyphomicrobiales TaxID=356 RepID=UPI00329742D7